MKTSKISLKPPCPELRGSLAGMKYPALLEIKTDGEFCFIHIEEGNTFTVNKYGTVRQDFKDLNHIETNILAQYKSATFLGELMMDLGKAGALYTLLSNKTNNDLQLYIFDIIELDRQDLRTEELITRKEILNKVQCGKSCAIKIVNDDKEAQTYFEIAVKKGYEGIVVKPLTGKLVLDICDWVKLKSKDRTDYQVKVVDNVQERIEIFAPVPQGHPNYPGVSVGVKCANKYKQSVKALMLQGLPVTIEHQGVLATGSLRHPVLIADPKWK